MAVIQTRYRLNKMKFCQPLETDSNLPAIRPCLLTFASVPSGPVISDRLMSLKTAKYRSVTFIRYWGPMQLCPKVNNGRPSPVRSVASCWWLRATRNSAPGSDGRTEWVALQRVEWLLGSTPEQRPPRHSYRLQQATLSLDCGTRITPPCDRSKQERMPFGHCCALRSFLHPAPNKQECDLPAQNIKKWRNVVGDVKDASCRG